MENPRNLSTNAIGFCLLPLELIQHILLNLALPEIMVLKSLNKSFSDLISDQVFVRNYNSRSKSTTWLFVYKKRWHRDAILHGFSDQSSDRWFKLQIANLLKPVISSGESIYFLAASGNFFMFSSNTHKEIIAVNLVTRTVKKIPPSPLGPRGTSSWRRSGMKLVSEPNNFRFLFTELVENQPVLFVYASETDKWLSMKAREDFGRRTPGNQREGDYIFLNVVNGPYESVVLAVKLESDAPPIVVRARLERDEGQQQLTVGFSWGDVIDRLYVYGDGHMLIIKSNGVGDADTKVRMLNDIELWGLGLSGRQWQYKSKVPSKIMEKIKKPYRVIMGCLEKRDGIIRAVLLSNFDGLWDIIWVSYDIERCYWSWVPVPDCKMKGLNMAGIAFSSGLSL